MHLACGGRNGCCAEHKNINIALLPILLFDSYCYFLKAFFSIVNGFCLMLLLFLISYNPLSYEKNLELENVTQRKFNLITEMFQNYLSENFPSTRFLN